MNKFHYLNFFLLLLFSCKQQQQQDVFLFRYDKYFNIVEEKKEVYILANKFFHKKFYKVSDINVKKFSELSNQYQLLRTNLKNNENNGILFMDNLCLNVYNLTANSNNKITNKIITYNYENLKTEKYNKSVILNYVIDFDLLYKTIISQIKSISKKNDFSDIAYIYCSTYQISQKISNKLQKDYPNMKTNNCIGSANVKSFINNEKNNYTTFVVFAFENNVALTELQENEITNNHFIEIFSNYGKTYTYIDKSIVINEKNFVQHCLYSNYTKLFLNDKLKNKVNKQKNKKDTQETDNNNEEATKQETQIEEKLIINEKGVSNIPLSFSNCLSIYNHKNQKENISFFLEKMLNEYIAKKEKENQK